MERRRYPRVPVSLEAGFCEPNDTTLLPCRIVDVSRGGTRIELSSDYHIESGETIELHVELPGHGRRIVGLLTCTWKRAVAGDSPGDGYVVGGFFSDLTPEDRQLLLDSAASMA